MVSRYLVTTALEDTWPATASPVLFLGEWCRRYERKASWEGRNAVIVPYHWDDRAKLYDDYLYLQKLHEELLVELAAKLNTLHAVNHSLRYWRIIVGPWLGYFIQMLFDRWAMLRKAVREFDVSEVRVLRKTKEVLIPNDMLDYHALFLGDAWNEAIYGQLLAWMEIPVKEVAALEVASGRTVTSPKMSFHRKTKRALAKVASRLSGALCLENEYFLMASYLPLKQDILLQLKLGQVPKIWRSIPVPTTPCNCALRQWSPPGGNIADDFSAIVRAMIPRHIPTAYLEGYHSLVTLTQRLPWPNSPKAIFTSTAFIADDSFKTWAAEKAESGTPVVIGQHGGNYGMARWSFTEDHQLAVCDRFLTWGWSQPEQRKFLPVGNLKGFGLKGTWDRRGFALLVGMTIPQASYHMYSIPVAGQWLEYFRDQVRFVTALTSELREHLVVRLYSQDYGWSQKARWHERFPQIHLDEGGQPLARLLPKTRLYISTYNATTYLESLSLNIPTLMFWNPKHWELRENVIPHFEELKSVGIFHDNPESAARQMAAVWEDVDGWWESEAVQSVRRSFCAIYAHIPAQPGEARDKLYRSITVGSA